MAEIYFFFITFSLFSPCCFLKACSHSLFSQPIYLSIYQSILVFSLVYSPSHVSFFLSFFLSLSLSLSLFLFLCPFLCLCLSVCLSLSLTCILTPFLPFFSSLLFTRFFSTLFFLTCFTSQSLFLSPSLTHTHTHIHTHTHTYTHTHFFFQSTLIFPTSYTITPRPNFPRTHFIYLFFALTFTSSLQFFVLTLPKDFFRIAMQNNKRKNMNHFLLFLSTLNSIHTSYHKYILSTFTFKVNFFMYFFLFFFSFLFFIFIYIFAKLLITLKICTWVEVAGDI